MTKSLFFSLTPRLMAFPFAVITIFATALMTTSCGKSPLLNHADAPPRAAQTSGDRTASIGSDCPLAFSVQKLCASIIWVKPATDDENGEFAIRFWRQGKAPGSESPVLEDPGTEVHVKLWMASMGHGSSKVKVSPRLDLNGHPVAGAYDATGVHFIMHGPWEIWVQLKTGKNIVDQAKVDIEI